MPEWMRHLRRRPESMSWIECPGEDSLFGRNKNEKRRTYRVGQEQKSSLTVSFINEKGSRIAGEVENTNALGAAVLFPREDFPTLSVGERVTLAFSVVQFADQRVLGDARIKLLEDA